MNLTTVPFDALTLLGINWKLSVVWTDIDARYVWTAIGARYVWTVIGGQL
jgi:hypothetical protein